MSQQQGIEDATYGEELTPEQCQKIQEVILSVKMVINKKVGRTELVKHRILTGDQPAIRQRPYRIPPALREDVISELQEMIADGVIEKSSSEWASPMVIVRKKDESASITGSSTP